MANGGGFIGAVITVAIGTMVGIWGYRKIKHLTHHGHHPMHHGYHHGY